MEHIEELVDNGTRQITDVPDLQFNLKLVDNGTRQITDVPDLQL